MGQNWVKGLYKGSKGHFQLILSSMHLRDLSHLREIAMALIGVPTH